MKCLVIIPARYASSRFPGKPLVEIDGKTMIRRVYEQVLKAKSVHNVLVATDDTRILREVERFGGTALMTRADHRSGTDRCAEAASRFEDYELIVNVQGDEPYIRPEQIDLLIEAFLSGENGEIGTLVKAVAETDQLIDPNIVKVVVSNVSKALYFSRQAIPFFRATNPESWLEKHIYYKHIGMYVFKNTVLQELSRLAPSKLEQAEQLEQLRWLENGYSVFVVETDQETFGIDTLEDLERLKLRLK